MLTWVLLLCRFVAYTSGETHLAVVELLVCFLSHHEQWHDGNTHTTIKPLLFQFEHGQLDAGEFVYRHGVELVAGYHRCGASRKSCKSRKTRMLIGVSR